MYLAGIAQGDKLAATRERNRIIEGAGTGPSISPVLVLPFPRLCSGVQGADDIVASLLGLKRHRSARDHGGVKLTNPASQVVQLRWRDAPA